MYFASWNNHGLIMSFISSYKSWSSFSMFILYNVFIISRIVKHCMYLNERQLLNESALWYVKIMTKKYFNEKLDYKVYYRKTCINNYFLFCFKFDLILIYFFPFLTERLLRNAIQSEIVFIRTEIAWIE